MKVVIIEDERWTAKDLARTILQIEPTAQIIAYIETVSDGLDFFSSEHDFDVIFSDVALGDGHSFEIFEKVELKTPIIFCTAYNEFALKAFQTMGIDYILKPFSQKEVEKAIQKLKTLSASNAQDSNTISDILEKIQSQLEPKAPSTIIIHQGDKIVPISIEKIAMFYIESSVVKAFTLDRKVLYPSQKLDELEKKFTPQFFRINRQFLVNRAVVKEASQFYHRKLLVHLSLPFDDQILVPKEKTKDFLDWLTKY